MWALLVACALARVTSLRAEVATIASIISNHADENADFNASFVNEIKANLQNNNDDYATDDPLTAASTSVVPPTGNRRRYNSSEMDEETEASPSSLLTTLVMSAEAFVRSQKHVKHNIKMKPTTLGSTTKVSEELSKAKGNVYKWKRLVEKNKRLRKYTSTSKIDLLTSPTHSPRVSYSVPIARAPVAQWRKKRTHRPRPRQVNRNVLPLRSPGPMRKPPNADQLDMAPARGAYIHDLRLKGRFCYRHVLWPEGPKYNSKGETIMPAFNGSLYKRKRSFFQTTKPIFMLPRCCNCCKKSVLGCQ